MSALGFRMWRFSRHWKSCRVSVATALLLLLESGCSVPVAELSLVSTTSADWPVMVLERGVEGRSCRSSLVLGLIPMGRQPSIVGEAIQRTLDVVPDGELLTNASVALATVDIVLFRRECAHVSGTVAKRVRVLHIH